jgi:hypothetical protein
LRRLVAGFLRMAPDVAIVGEVRDREGLPADYASRSVRVPRWLRHHEVLGIRLGGEHNELVGEIQLAKQEAEQKAAQEIPDNP